MLGLTPSISRQKQNERAEYIDNTKPNILRIVRIQFCDKDSCAVLDKPHLLIKWDHVKRDRKRAVAVSYTWGEFERREVVIGHDPSSLPQALTLGQEWDIEELQGCLVKLSADYGGCWIDQLCIEQEEKKIRQSLASIPSIYRSLDVVAIMPGSACACLQGARQVVEAFESGQTTEEVNMVHERVHKQLMGCLNSAGLNSWFDRLWPRQEFMYSRRISIMRTSKALVPCVKSEDDIESLGAYSRLLFERNLEHQYSRADAYRAVQVANVFFLSSAADAIADYLPHNSPESAAAGLARFLLGDTIDNQQPLYSREDVYGRCNRFLSQLGKLGKSSRKATNHWDYVTSVWVDCPGYNIPPDYKAMELPALLEHAILQLEKNVGISPTSNAPAGLFGDRGNGGLWRPTTSLKLSDVLTARDIYGVLSPAHYVPVFEGSIPLISFGERSMPLSSTSNEYTRIFYDWKTADVLATLQNIFAQVPVDVLARFLPVHLRDDHTMRATTPPGDHLLQSMFEERVLSRSMPGSSVGQPDPGWNLPEIDHHDVVYRMVTIALGLSKSRCQDQGLRLMISLDYPQCLGLMKPQFSTQPYEPNVRKRVWKSIIQTYPYVTVCTTKDGDHIGCSLLEASFVRTGPPAVLEVAGIWVPMKYTPFHNINGMARECGIDGRLGGPFDRESPDDVPRRSSQQQHHAQILGLCFLFIGVLYALLNLAALLNWASSLQSGGIP